MKHNIDFINKKKKEKKELTKTEIHFVVNGYLNKTISDKDMTIFLKLIKKNGMTNQETFFYTDELLNSGEQLPLKDNWVDKHSTGGIGDKTSIILLPILSAMNLKIMKISGRSLGYTGGTLDKLESIEGFNVNLKLDEAIKQTEKYGIAMTSQTISLCPADKVIYSLRDITGTVDSFPLIAASVMSKKIASGAKNILIDLKVGSGAFVKNLKEANELGNIMKKIGDFFNRNVFILFSSMQEPLGKYIGNSSEIYESKEFLLGNKREKKLYDLLEKITSELYSKSFNVTKEIATNKFKEVLNNGLAYKKFLEWIKLQGGNIKSVKNDSYFNPKLQYFIKSNNEGFLSFKNLDELGETLTRIGMGRVEKDQKINHNIGMKLKYKSGEYIKKYSTLFVLYSDDNNIDEKIFNTLKQSFDIKKNTSNNLKIILGEIPW